GPSLDRGKEDLTVLREEEVLEFTRVAPTQTIHARDDVAERAMRRDRVRRRLRALEKPEQIGPDPRLVWHRARALGALLCENGARSCNGGLQLLFVHVSRRRLCEQPR